MRAMAIMYIGPLRNPDFATDYHLSPILAPSELLAQFPPLLMQCGEKDPFVDDTIIFAGRVREAKRRRKIDLDTELSGKYDYSDEGPSMKQSSSINVKRLAMLRSERDKLRGENEDDWIQMVIFTDWSHGYMQMPMLMSEARETIYDTACWMVDAFSAKTTRLNSTKIDGERRSLYNYPVHSSDDEMDMDEAITFVPKRRGLTAETTRSSLSSSERLPAGGPKGEHEGPIDSWETLDNNPREAGGSSIRSAIGKSKLRQTGQTISERELMRRRRLLDSHVFSGGELLQ
jgi:alpha/beta hydrolase fold